MSTPGWFATGAVRALNPDTLKQLLRRGDTQNDGVRASSLAIIDAVRDRGDTALRELASRFDGVALEALEVPMARARDALDALPNDLEAALRRAATNIDDVHRAFLPAPLDVVTRDGVLISRRADPVARAGVYAPGGRAAYPSSVLMGVVPARVAGVPEIIVCSPPDSTGCPSNVVMAAAVLGGATRIFAIGGAGAIAAMAFGTASVPRVDRIVGPGNAYVAAAKQLVTHLVGIDSPAGPSELLIIADANASVDVAVREVLAQAEHDPAASVVVLATDGRWARALSTRVLESIAHENRASIIAQAIRERGAVLEVPDVESALAFASEFAPEHLLLLTDTASSDARRARNAGSVFVGEASSIAFGDYLTGANHVLPTAGHARAYSGLSTLDFLRWTTIQNVSRDAASRLAADTAALAIAEGLPAHAAAARQWSVA
jgi:histidinol dehydrogenase